MKTRRDTTKSSGTNLWQQTPDLKKVRRSCHGNKNRRVMLLLPHTLKCGVNIKAGIEYNHSPSTHLPTFPLHSPTMTTRHYHLQHQPPPQKQSSWPSPTRPRTASTPLSGEYRYAANGCCLYRELTPNSASLRYVHLGGSETHFGVPLRFETIPELADAQTVVTFTWIPFIIWVGYRNSDPQPSLIK